MNNEKTVNSTIKNSTVKATPKKKKMKETSEIPLKHGKLLTTIMTIVTLVYVCPIFIVLMNSFKANTFVKTDTFAWPTGEALVGWANYIKGFTFGNYPFFKSVLYSFVITVLSTALILICTSMAAWYIARVDSMVCKIVYYLFVFSMVVPFQMVMFTLSNTADSLGLNTPWMAHCLEKSISKIETAILSALENTPPELYADIVHNGIYLAGGGALLRGLDKRLTDKINIPFHIAEDPLHAVAKGTGVALKNVDRFSFLMR